ncbi:MAG: translation initiation factor IF-3 [Patescibacteria group bacterium]
MGDKIEKSARINGEISSPEVHLIMDDGRSAGTVSTDQARYLAAQAELDLVEIGAKASPPVAKLLDYNKYKYQQEKHARQSRSKTNEMKEIRLGFKTDEHDIETKAKKAQKFLSDGSIVKVFVVLRGRENIFPDIAKQKLDLFRQQIGAEFDQPPLHIGKRVQCILRKTK